MKKSLRLLLSIAMLIGLSGSPAAAQTFGSCPGVNFFPRPLGYQQLTVSSTAVGFTVPTAGRTRLAVVVVESNPIRYRDDGTNPTAAVGTPADPKNGIIVCAGSIATFKAIRTGSDAIINISYYGDF